MTTRMRVLAPVGTFVAVTAVAVTAAVVTGGSGGTSAPRRLDLAGTSRTAQDAASTILPAYGAPGGSGGYTLDGSLPTDRPDDAPAFTLSDGPASVAAVTRLAEALGAGTPVRDGKGWRADGLGVSGESGRGWWWSACGSEMSVSSGAGSAPTLTTPAVGCVVAVDGGGSSGSGGSSTSGSSGSAGSGTLTAPPVPPEDVPAIPPPAPRPSAAPDVPVPTGVEPPVDQPLPLPPPQPSPGPAIPAATVRTAVAPVLEALGLDEATISTTPYGGAATVDPQVNGLATNGFTTRIEVDAAGKLVSASGFLSTPTRADSYPLLSAQQAYDALPSSPVALGMPCQITAESKGCVEPAPMVITGATLGLAMTYLTSGEQLLVPAWLFAVRGSDYPAVGIAVQPAYLGGPDPEPTGGTIEPDPATTKPGQTEPGQTEPVPPAEPVDPAAARQLISVMSVAPGGAPDSLVATYENGGCGQHNLKAMAKETDEAVYVVLEVDAPPADQMCTADSRPATITVPLQQPLGDRTVYDASTNEKAPRTP